MNLKNWKEWAFIFMIIGCIQFFILTILAMIFYAGGTGTDPNNPGYSFWSNFFSDTGRVKAWSGRNNTISYIIFTISLSIIGISLIIFIIAFQRFFNIKKIEKILSIFGSITGLISGILHVGIAFTPWDLYYDYHVMFVKLAFSSALLTAILYTIVIFLNKEYPKQSMYVFLAFVFILGVYLGILFMGPNINTTEGLTIQATAQKIVDYSFITCLLFQSYQAWKFETS